MDLLSNFNKSQNVKVCCIYKVTNKLNGKVYIGQTTNFRKRLSDYMNAHKKTNLTQTIVRKIIQYGTENFTIEILEECDSSELADLENKWIKKYNSHNSDYGYNIVANNKDSKNSEISRKRKSLSHIGLKESSETKKKKSNIILAIKDNNILVCDSAKLFGDYVGASKDMIKNCLRQPSKICGYRVYYDDYQKRQEIRKKMLKKRCIRDSGYMDILNILDNIEFEGVETIYLYFDSISRLIYDDDKYKIVPYTINEVITDEDVYVS